MPSESDIKEALAWSAEHGPYTPVHNQKMAAILAAAYRAAIAERDQARDLEKNIQRQVQIIAALEAELAKNHRECHDRLLLVMKERDEARAEVAALQERVKVLSEALGNWAGSWGKGYEMERLSYEEAMIALAEGNKS